MNAVLQRVATAGVSVDGNEIARIGRGMVILLGVGKDDDARDASGLAEKIANLRIFEDQDGKMNLSILDTGGEALVVSQFTLLGDCRKGRRPGFDAAAAPEMAFTLYNEFVEMLAVFGVPCAKGQFQAKMLVDIQNDGPVTFVLDSRSGSH